VVQTVYWKDVDESREIYIDELTNAAWGDSARQKKSLSA
jgi:hypothetical protein